VLFLLFVAVLMIAARLLLRGDRRPPVLPNENPTAAFHEPARRAQSRDRR
jgi:hypothetical protein